MRRPRGCLAWLLVPALAWAQGAPRWVDREIDAARLGPALTEPMLELPRDPSGPPRSLALELRAQSDRSGGREVARGWWTVARGLLDTDNHGFFTLDANLRLQTLGDARGGGQGGTATLAQRRLAFDSGWVAHSELGLVGTGAVDLPAPQVRLGLPTRLVQGVITEWAHEARGLSLMAGGGEPVSLDAVGQSGLRRLGGRSSMAGLRWAGHAAWSLGLQLSGHRSDGSDGTGSGDGALLTARWAAGSRRWGQLNLLHTQPSGLSARQGAWFDGNWSDGAVEHRLGLNWLPDRYEWLGLGTVSGTVGGLYRWRFSTRRLQTELQFDRQRVGARDDLLPATTLTQLWASARWLPSQRDAVGLQSTALAGAGERSWRLATYFERYDPMSSWRVFADAQWRRPGTTEWQLGAGGSAEGFELRWTAAAAVLMQQGQAPGSDLSLTAQVDFGERGSASLGARRVAPPGRTPWITSLTAQAQWRLAPGWSATASVVDARGGRLPAPAGPADTAPEVLPTLAVPQQQSRVAWLGLRYDFSAGSAMAPLGGSPGSGGGRVEGTLFLDANGNGVADAGEQRLAGITVVLDERYGVRTDAEGRFAFPFVAPGAHRLRVLPDNIPLPWGLGEEAMRTIEVPRRGQVVLDLGARRQ